MNRNLGTVTSLMPAKRGKVCLKKIEDRPYQADLISRSLGALLKGSNTVVVLPSGLGKTTISQMVSLAWLKLKFKLIPKVLVLVPNRLSFWVYPALASRLEELVALVYLDYLEGAKTSEIDQHLQKAEILVSTPGKLISLLVRNEIDVGAVNKFSLVVVDNYDDLAFSVSRELGNFRNDIEMLMSLLVACKPLFLLLSSNYEDVNYRLVRWEKVLEPVKIEAEPASYQEYIPSVNLKFRGIVDPEVIRNDRKLSKHIAVNMMQIKQRVYDSSEIRHPVRVKQILSQMRKIASGKQNEFYLHFRKQAPLVIPVDRQLRIAFQNLSLAVRTRLQLFEDVWSEPEFGVASKTTGYTSNHWGSLSNVRVNLKGKIDCIKEIIYEKSGKRGLIFCRRLEICELVAGAIVNLGIPAFIIHRNLKPAELQRRVEEYLELRSAVLLSPRLLGVRDLDIPEADYAVFYSPKDDEIAMRQEIARIRSLRQHPKEVFILFYRDTGEESKLKRLLWKMKGKTNYHFTDLLGNEATTE